jgi:hypothetical protein
VRPSEGIDFLFQMRQSVPLMDLVQEVAYEYGNLVKITGGRDEVLLPQRPVAFDQVALTFERGVMTVIAQGDDDTVELRQGLGTAAYTYELTGGEPLSGFVGRGVQWVWLLRNQQGYQDGFQIEFKGEDDRLALQMICEASMLRIALLYDPDLSVRL